MLKKVVDLMGLSSGESSASNIQPNLENKTQYLLSRTLNSPTNITSEPEVAEIKRIPQNLISYLIQNTAAEEIDSEIVVKVNSTLLRTLLWLP